MLLRGHPGVPNSVHLVQLLLWPAKAKIFGPAVWPAKAKVFGPAVWPAKAKIFIFMSKELYIID